MADNRTRQSVPGGHLTWHMTPVEVWERQRRESTYIPEGFNDEGFIHCTDDLAELVAVGNRYYRNDQREWIALEVDCDQVGARVIYEDPQCQFPHIYGALPVTAVRRVAPLVRSHDGTFLTIDLEQEG